MYTIKIENVEKQNGQPFASVSFTRDTGETEMYKELVVLTSAILEERDPETDEVIVEAKDAVYDYVENTRPVIEVVYERIAFNDQAQLDERIASKNAELEAKQTALTAVTTGEYVIPAPVAAPEPIEPTAEALAEVAAMTAKAEWQKKKEVLKSMISDMRDMESIGAVVSPEKIALMQGIAAWCDANVKEEYYA